MRLLGLELSDAGIMAAGSGLQKLVEVDDGAVESPGVVLAEKKHLLVGIAAEKKAHLYPRLVSNRFWDQLNVELLDRHQPHAKRNPAEMVYAHLSRIWKKVQPHGDEIIAAVPGFYKQEQLGLLLGIAEEASLPIKGFVPLALAAAQTPCPQRTLVHLDIHLHRVEIIFLKQANDLSMEESVSISEKGLVFLYKAFVEMMAAQFVRTTRFDPLHQAAYEQELYDRLPAVLKKTKSFSTVDLEITGDAGTYRTALARAFFVGQTAPLFTEISRMITNRLKRQAGANHPLTLQLSHRVAQLPGSREVFGQLKNTRLIELNRGAAAFGVLGLWNRLSAGKTGPGVSFFTSRPWDADSSADSEAAPNPAPADNFPSHPTHILYRHLAYPLTESPLVIGLKIGPAERGIQLQGQDAGVAPRQCSLERRGSTVVLINFSAAGTLVDETLVHESSTLEIGQTIRVGASGEALHLIAAAGNHAT